MEYVYSEVGHRGYDASWVVLRSRFFWLSMGKDLKAFVQSCHKCQMCTKASPQEVYKSRPIHSVMTEISMDHVFMDGTSEMKYLLDARCNFSGWIEARPVPTTSATHVISFLEDVLSRHGGVYRVVADNGSVGCYAVREFLASRGIELRTCLPYNPRGNSVVERGHRDLINAIMRLSLAQRCEWTTILPAALWADRITINSTGYSPFYLMYARDPLSPLDLLFTSWRKKLVYPMTHQNLLEFRITQVLDHQLLLRKAQLLLSDRREQR